MLGVGDGEEKTKEANGMFTKLSDTSQAAIFSVLVLLMATGVALTIRFLELSPNMGMWILWSCTPTVAALIMLLVVTREGYSREGWKVLGLHRLGLNVWWIAFGLTLLITVVASAVVWATPLASFVVPENGIFDSLLSFLIQVVILMLTFSLAEEIGIRGYLLPKLLALGRTRALTYSGLVFATWHMPLILLTPVFPVGNKLISLPLFYGTVVAASFVYGYLRIYTGSVWPASLAHAVHNAAWGALGAVTATSYPVIVNKYLVGDFGVLILVGAGIGAVWLNRRLMEGSPDEPQPGVPGGRAPAV
jgi:membrane protease YdiL (CAAX protease family)